MSSHCSGRLSHFWREYIILPGTTAYDFRGPLVSFDTATRECIANRGQKSVKLCSYVSLRNIEDDQVLDVFFVFVCSRQTGYIVDLSVV
jgi:hypothetical protein